MILDDEALVERVARAIANGLEDASCFVNVVEGDLGKCIVDGGLFDMRSVATAAIEAVRVHMWDDGK